jgi:F-type H+-transporting ATPase subunit a
VSLYLYKNLSSSDTNPTKVQILFEMFYESLGNFVTQITGDRAFTMRIFPIIAALLLYILLGNTLTLIPPISFLEFNDTALFRTHTSDFNVTFSIALGVIVLSHFVSARKFGIFGHLFKYIKINKFFSSKARAGQSILFIIIDFFLGLLDLISEMAKVFSLSLRLFGNMFAAEILMLVIMGMFALVLPALWAMMGVLSGVIQAIVFAALASSYLAVAVKE